MIIPESPEWGPIELSIVGSRGGGVVMASPGLRGDGLGFDKEQARGVVKALQCWIDTGELRDEFGIWWNAPEQEGLRANCTVEWGREIWEASRLSRQQNTEV